MKNESEFKVQLASPEFEDRGKNGKDGFKYLDSKLIPTIGVGFKLTRDDADDQLKNCGVDDDKLEDVKNGKERLTEEQMMKLLDVTVAENEKYVKRKIGADVFDALHEKQQWALVSLAFNGQNKLFGPNLIQYASLAVTSDDQEKAYIEILTKSNKDKSKGIQNRREKEAAWYLEGLNQTRAEHNLKPIEEHPLAHCSNKSDNPNKKLCDSYNNKNHAKDKNWQSKMKNNSDHHDHTSIDKLLESIENKTENIKETIFQENNRLKEIHHADECKVDNDRRYSPASRMR